jgi:hypothetical protein
LNDLATIEKSMDRLTHNRPTEVDSDTENIAGEITTLLSQLNNCEKLVKLKNIAHNVWKEKNGTRNKRKIENTVGLCPISPSKRQQRKDSNKHFNNSCIY